MPNEKMNILVTLDENYIPHLNVMLTSLIHSNPDAFLSVYLLHTAIDEQALDSTVDALGEHGTLIPVQIREIGLEGAPTTARYPKEIYYRIFAARYLPASVDRVLYLDPDLIVNGSLGELYALPMDGYYFAAASHNGPVMRKINELRLGMEEKAPYINSGVMLMNLELLRREQDYDEVFRFIDKYKHLLALPDQDIISGLYGGKILALDPLRYNMTEKLFRFHSVTERNMDLDWVRAHSVIIHYCGKNKPWKSKYFGDLDLFYHETVMRMKGNER